MLIFQDYPFIVPLIALILAETIKVILSTIKQKKLVTYTFLHSGGMPSGHSALVGSLLTLVYLKNSISSVEFAIAVVIFIVVSVDAVKIRWQAGKHAVVLNQLQKKEKLDEKLGHTFWQMAAGVVLGAVITFVLI